MGRLVVLVSGSGTNLQAIIDAYADKRIPGEIAAVISNRPDALALERAKKAGIPTFVVEQGDKERETFDKEVASAIDSHEPDLIVLAGYMRILSPWFVIRYKGRIINIHPALLPSFPGTHGYEDAWEYGVKVSGCTVHFVDEGVDTGPIIIQKGNPITDDDTFESFQKRGLALEHEALPEAIALFLSGRLNIDGRRVRINDG
ncbi:MAG: phosphoribosylglycinamide formyltransferase [archaeon]